MIILNKILCFFGSHKYNPIYEQRWRERNKKRTHVKSRFECIHCQQKTKWLNKKDTENMLESKNCDWGL